MGEIRIDNRVIQVRGLTRREIRDQLKDLGFSSTLCRPTIVTAETALETAFNIVLDPADIEFLDDQPNPVTLKVWKEILKETYGDPDEEKNLNGTSDGG